LGFFIAFTHLKILAADRISSVGIWHLEMHDVFQEVQDHPSLRKLFAGYAARNSVDSKYPIKEQSADFLELFVSDRPQFHKENLFQTHWLKPQAHRQSLMSQRPPAQRVAWILPPKAIKDRGTLCPDR
jgi:hypothetical protein